MATQRHNGERADPTVSIILPTYQRAALLERAIDSVFRQTYADFELLIVDDGSTDHTGEVVQGLRDPRLRVLRHDVNRGAAAARNLGIRHARASFLAFQDSDDEWLPQKLERHMRAFASCGSGVGVVYSDMLRIKRDGPHEYHRSPDVVRGRLLDPDTGFYQVCGIGIQSCVIRRECLAAVGDFNESCPALEDLELFIRLSRGYDFHRLAEPLVLYHETDGLSQNRLAKMIARRLMLELYGRELSGDDAEFVTREQAALEAVAARLRAADVA